MTDYITEQEQIELIKKWLKNNGLAIIGGIAAALIIVSGWHYWQYKHAQILADVSSVYTEMLTSRTQNNTDQVAALAQKLKNHYATTTYASMAALMLARDAVLNKKYDDAKTQLTWVLEHNQNKALRAITTVRLARINIAENNPNGALKTLNNADDPNFAALIASVKGDAYLALHDVAKAKTAYQTALDKLPNDLEDERKTLQMKLDNVSNA